MKTKLFFSTAFLMLFTYVTQAQDSAKRFGVELSMGVSMATGELSGTTLNPGYGFEGILQYRFMSYTSVYGGWGLSSFGAEESFAGDDVCFEETGYVFGLEFKHPFGASPVQYYVRAGGLYGHIETDNSEGDNVSDTSHGLGWQLSGGVEVPMGKNWSFRPGLKFSSLSGESDYDEITKELNLNYVSLRVGFAKEF